MEIKTLTNHVHRSGLTLQDLESANGPFLQDDSAVQEERIKAELRQEIVRLWKIVWLGIYRIGGLDGPSHSYSLRRLYLGAGLESGLWESPIEPGSSRREYGWYSGIYFLKLFDVVSIQTLGSVVDLLTDYVVEVQAVRRAYEFLASHQRDPYYDSVTHPRFRGPKLHVQLQWNRMSASLRENLWELQLRTGALNQAISDEARRLFLENPSIRLGGWYVRDRAFPNRRH